jgi:small-conductance mechanosensitive channel/CRP-like cAMP-binding protein
MDALLSSWTAGNPFGWTGIAAGLGLLLVAMVVLPPSQRPRLRAPLLFVVLHGATAMAQRLAPPHVDASRPWFILSLAFLWLAFAQLLPLLLVDGMLGHRLRWQMPKIFRDILQLGVYFGVLLVVLHSVGVEPRSLLTTSALLTAVIGLSLQDTLGNLFAGLAIQAQRPFEVGDYVQLADSVEPLGRVVEINWRATKVITNDRIEIIVPNANLARSSIRNFSRPEPYLRRHIRVQAPYEFAPSHIRSLMLRAVEGTPGVLTQPQPQVIVGDFAADGMVYILRYFTDDIEGVHPVDGRVRERIWHAFRRAGVAIPYAQRDVHVYQMQAEDTHKTRDLKLAQRRRTLRGVELFDVLPDEAIDLLCGLVHSRRYAAGEFILRRGDPGSDAFIVEQGTVAVVVDQGGNQFSEVARLGAGKVFGEMSLMTGAARTATVRAVDDVALLVIDKAAFQQVLQESPELAGRLAAVLAQRNEQLEREQARVSDASQQAGDGTSDILDRLRAFFSL